MDPVGARNPWRWDAEWMNAAWLRGVRDVLDWVLGERTTSPLCRRSIRLPTTYELTHEDGVAKDILMQGRPGGLVANPDSWPPPQYGEGIHATILWLRGENTAAPVGRSAAYGPDLMPSPPDLF